MSWYKSLARFPSENLSNIPYGCCDFASVYHGVGKDSAYIRFKANIGSEPKYVMDVDIGRSLFPEFYISNSSYGLVNLVGTYKACLGSDSVFWAEGDAVIKLFPRIELTSSTRMEVYANEVDSWEGKIPAPGETVQFLYSGKRSSEFVAEYGWGALDVLCRWDLQDFYILNSDSVISEGFGEYINSDKNEKRVFGTPKWSYDGGNGSCIRISPSEYCAEKTGAVLLTYADDVWVYGTKGSSTGWWESKDAPSQSEIGEKTVFKFCSDSNAEKQPDIEFIFDGYIEYITPVNVNVSEVALWR